MHFIEQRLLREQQRCEDKRKAEESYENWKQQKDLEQRLMISNNIPAEPNPKRNYKCKPSLFPITAASMFRQPHLIINYMIIYVNALFHESRMYKCVLAGHINIVEIQLNG